MSKKNPHRPFTPNPEFLSLLPEKYGNAVNGLGETEVRRPDMVWWAPNMDEASFGEAQKWFYNREQPGPELLKERAKRKDILEAPLPDLADEQKIHSPQEWTKALDAFIETGDCEMVGVARMQEEWAYSDKEVLFDNVIMLGVQHNYDQLKSAPDQLCGTDVSRQYNRAAFAAKKIAAWLRELGWDAKPVTGPMVGDILMIPPALECGFGELGKHGSLINPEFGSAFRLGAVLTNAPFAITPKREFGIDDFCSRCRVCENACPPFAITPEKQTVRGVEKWYVDFNECIPFFAETSGCAICIAVCPWSLPGVGPNLADKLARRAERKRTEGDEDA
ncbi:MAG: 4Fe-4S dicluster domain-containing protein [Pseudomonadales bacterium]